MTRPEDSGPEASGGKGGLRRWSELDAEAQLQLRMDYGRYLDALPPTCSMDTKLERFRTWLADRGVELDRI